MNIDSACGKEHLSFFLKYINPEYLFYSITSLVFASVFLLTWILKKYTFFEKNKRKVPVPILPFFPYGNFKDVVKQAISLHEFLWKYYTRFKRKSYKFGGLFLFTKPVVLIIDAELIQNVNKNQNAFKDVFPEKLRMNSQKIDVLLSSALMDTFVETYKQCLKGSLSESIRAQEIFSALKDFFLESICQAFGFSSSEMVEEINNLLKETTSTSFKYYFGLSFPFFKTSPQRLESDLRELFLEIMETRKKNDIRKDDLLQCFIELYNESDCSLDDIVHDVFNLFSSTLMYSYSTTILSLYELAKNTDIQEDLIGEIRRFYKKSSNLNNSSLAELNYLDAVVKETLRKYPPVPTICKECCDDQEASLQVPKDTIVYISVLGIHRDPQNFTNADEFDPDRFTEEHGTSKNDSYIPFGTDSRREIDMKLTTLQTKLALVSILSSLRVSFKEGSLQDLKIDPKLMCLGVNENFSFKFELL